MKWLREQLVEPEKDGYEVYEVTYLERRMTDKHWDAVQKELEMLARAALGKK